MSPMGTPTGWGPSHQTRERQERIPRGVQLVLFVVVVMVWPTIGAVWFLVIAVVFGILAVGLSLASRATRSGNGLVGEVDPLAAVRHRARLQGGGVYLGLEEKGEMRFARAQRAVLLLGPPRSGKTSAVIIPALIVHRGPAVCTSTKLDVAASTWPARRRSGRLWVFDPTASGEASVLEPLRWSPIRCAQAWDGAMLMARAMTASVGAGTTHGSHWAKRSQAVLAPFLRDSSRFGGESGAAGPGGRVGSVLGWGIKRHGCRAVISG